MRPEVESLLDELRRQGREHDGAQADRRQRYRNLEPESGRLLAQLARLQTAHRVLEIGASNGVSTLWLAGAVAPTGGTVTSVELDPVRAAEARANVARAGLDAAVQVHEADALAWLPARGAEAEYDLVFLDAERSQYVELWPDVRRAVRPGGLVVVDNVISHAGELVAFRGVLEADREVTAVEVPVGAGLLLVHRGAPVGDPTDAVRQGGCLCGAVRFELSAPLRHATHCHCSRCRRHSGSSGLTQADVAADGFRLLQGAEQVRVYRPDGGAVKAFCTVCGSSVFGGSWPAGAEVTVRLGALDEDPGTRPEAHVYVASRAAWDVLPGDGLRRYDGGMTA